MPNHIRSAHNLSYLMAAREIHQRIANLHAYAGLALGLEPGEGGARNPQIRKTLNAISGFLRIASPRELKTQGKELEAFLLNATKAQRNLKPRRPLESIGNDFIRLGKSQDVWRYGVAYGWLAEQFVPPILALPLDLPAHARVGLANHAGSASVEEATLLDDAFLLLTLTQNAYDRMMASGRLIDEPRSAREALSAHQTLTRLNLNVGTFARLTVVTIAAFIESFVNSVGSNEAARRPTLDAAITEQLNGMRKGRFLTLEFKMERFPALIRPDGLSPLRVLDEKQRQEPFRRFLAETKEVRDAAMHYSPSKMAIVCTPQEWLRRADNSAADAVAVARAFWVACYPNSGYPSYLFDLDTERLKVRAASRVAAGEGRD